MSRRREEKLAERADRLAEEQAFRAAAPGGTGVEKPGRKRKAKAVEDVGAHLAPDAVPTGAPAPSDRNGRAAGAGKSGKAAKSGKEKAPGRTKELFVPHRGWYGVGGGRVGYMDPPTMWRATTVQACGMWPFAAGSGSPMTGVPLGQHLFTGATVCGDPLNWFTRARYISNPSLFMLGMPGLGKSTLVNRMLIGLAATGVVPLVLGDLKPDYADTVRALGGQVISIGRGRGGINVLDPGAMGAAAAKIGGEAGEVLKAEAHGRVLNMVAALVTIVRGRPMDDHEQSVLSAVLHHLRERTPQGRTVLLPDVLRVLTEGPPRVRAVTLDRGDDARYRDAVDPLHRSLLGILDGPLGDTFASETSTRIDPNAPAVCIDISGIGEADTQLTAAAMLAAWSDGLGTVAASHALADAGLAPRRWFFTVLDELWRPLRAASGIVDRIDALTRLNRSLGLGDAKITHTLKDAEALGTDADRAKARGFVERAGMVVCAGLPRTEMEDLGKVVGLSRREIELVSSWSSPPGWGVNGDNEEPPGRGRFLIKVGGRPGIPIKVAITDAERHLHNTNTRWTPNEDAVEQAAARAAQQVARAAQEGVLPGGPGTEAAGRWTA
ncbi:ATP/GTP-binding protein [Streptomyces sp. NBC_00687]|uniref:ATP/GTP-binding protein n=1 Tax=Streptomyces sp. NBC_00687 TaxID=2975807 RepID=UPI00224F1BB5|nr:ATP/GTP-binding protein [Streptomyces sp. NBC_00687]MCX4915505.1 ATP/GTP-binding protein [Streptomyces sp. NBC_00687]